MGETGWHLEISSRDWILWGYGPPGSVTHVAPANVFMDFGHPMGKFTFPFELPKRVKDLPAPRVHDRVHAWGWRFKMDNLMHETWWRLTDTREQALEEAVEDVETSPSIRNPDRHIFRAALKDVRETVIEDEPGPSPKEWSPKKTSSK